MYLSLAFSSDIELHVFLVPVSMACFCNRSLWGYVEL